jgi:hypothetical protein
MLQVGATGKEEEEEEEEEEDDDDDDQLHKLVNTSLFYFLQYYVRALFATQRGVIQEECNLVQTPPRSFTQLDVSLLKYRGSYCSFQPSRADPKEIIRNVQLLLIT